jgi:two-component system, chemotaxis family, response regulator Rcp1
MLTLLMVDDNQADIELLRDACTELAIGANIIGAENGLRALSVLEKIVTFSEPRPTGILLDLNMPQMDGRDVLSFIKGTPDLSSIPTIILTSSASPLDRKQCLDLGADAYFTKPNTLDELNQLIRNIEKIVRPGPLQQLFVALPSPGTSDMPTKALVQIGAWIGARIRSAISCSP